MYARARRGGSQDCVDLAQIIDKRAGAGGGARAEYYVHYVNRMPCISACSSWG